MCGRFNIVDEPLVKFTSDLLGLEFNTSSNSNVCPSDSIATVTSIDNKTVQINANWGIKPSWAKKLLINAQSETIDTKKTFQHAYRNNRCVIPFSGWYEWKTKTPDKHSTTKKSQKQKYLFDKGTDALFMAGILFEKENTNQFELVSLTTVANEICLPIHHRMPLLINHLDVQDWLTKETADIERLRLSNTYDINIREIA